ncbi:DNA-directed RNA polymerase subunit omega [Thermodesulfovibrionales bacterium]|nr:DNA-directed RNA polymerase subunit omega [Thermodesulfovibrionales bacterium]MCL0086683.1 DNA-directed RNA polymerase subunit omega [Thermodesulfovibrionales bacterium]
MDIISLPIEYDKKKIDSRYRLVVIAAQRARELSLGVKQKIQTESKKITTTAILETISGEIEFLTGKEAIVAKEKAERIDYRKIIREGEKKRPAEDLLGLEKDLEVYLHEKETPEKDLKELFNEAETEKDEDNRE